MLLGNGNGTFQSPASYSESAADTVAIGDFNEDGKLDLAVANLDDNNVSVLLGNGDGTFQPALNYGAGSYPVSLAATSTATDGRTLPSRTIAIPDW